MSDVITLLQRELHEVNIEAQRYKREVDELRQRARTLVAHLRDTDPTVAAMIEGEILGA